MLGDTNAVAVVLSRQPPSVSRPLLRKLGKHMSFFPNSRNIVITGNNVTMNSYSGSQAADRGAVVSSQKVLVVLIIIQGFDLLCRNATAAAWYGSSALTEDHGCLYGTRLDVRDHIFKWFNNPESEVAMWMYGPAGIGKTAIAQTVAKVCAEQEQLSSTFFFFRSDDGRNSAKHLIPTLAYGMVQQIPHTYDVICTRTGNNPLILSAPLDPQIRTMILPALLAPLPSLQNTPPGPMLIIIDGLDECMDTAMQ